MDPEKTENITAMSILSAIERDVNEGTFDKNLYTNDIKSLSGQIDELSLLSTEFGQLKDFLPEYSDCVDEMLNDIEDLMENAAVNAVRFNDNFNSLMDMLTSEDRGDSKKHKIKNKRIEPLSSDVDTTSTDEITEEDKPILHTGVLLNQLLILVEQQWVTESDFEKIPKMMGVEELSAMIFILTEISYLLRSIPVDIFANDETKQNIIMAAQECLDGLIEQETDEEIESVTELEQGFGIVGEITADLGFVSSGNEGINVCGLNNKAVRLESE